jgi:predicted ATPase
MFKSIEIENFRCFEKFKMSNLSHINIITGKNNVGKTSLLEALYLLVGHHNAGLALRINQQRGTVVSKLDMQALLKWIFHDGDISQKIRFNSELLFEEGVVRKVNLAIGVKNPEVTTLQLGEAKSENLVSEPDGVDGNFHLVFNCKLDEESSEESEVWIEGNETKLKEGKQLFSGGVYLHSKLTNAPENVTRFSKLSEYYRKDEVVEVVQMLEPRLRDLDVLHVAGVNVIAADIGLERKIPVGYMGEGFNKLLTIILAILDCSNGYFLIDEIENGFHHSVMEKVWLAIVKVSQRDNVQVFASTHSAECIEAASAVFPEVSEEDFSVRHIEEMDGYIRPFPYDKKKLEAAMETGVEVR